MSKQVVPLCLELGLVCHLLGGISRRWVKELCKSGELKGHLLGKKWVIDAASVNAYLEKNRVHESEG